MSPDVEVAVIGSGVVGAATASALARAGHAVAILEKRARAGGEITERNSGVIHAGLHAPPEALKTRLAIEGRELLYAWAEAHGVPHARTGKLILAIDAEDLEALEQLAAHGRRLGIQVEPLTSQQLQQLEPQVVARRGLWVPDSGVIDPVALTRSLLDDARAHGAALFVAAEVTAAAPAGGRWHLETARGPLSAARVVNCAGLASDRVARLAGDDAFTIHPCRGDYFRISSRLPLKHLIYPMKKPGAPGLGIHVTVSPGGEARLGPDARWVQGENYALLENEAELRDAFLRAARRYLPALTAAHLTHDGCGLRPKLRGPTDPEERDFVIRESAPGFLSLLGIESPGLTAALALAKRVARWIER